MSYQQYSPQGFRVLMPVVKNIIIINALMFLATFSLQRMGIDLVDLFGLRYFTASEFAPYQFITYMFMHGGFTHIFFNMFAVWMFGNILEQVWGPGRFITYYLITGVGAALVHYGVMYFEISPVISQINDYLTNPTNETLLALGATHSFHLSPQSGELWPMFQEFRNATGTLQLQPDNMEARQVTLDFLSAYKSYYLNQPNVIGASGAVFGILLAFGMLFPNSLIYIFFAIPIKAKWFVILYGAIELYAGISGSMGSNIAHFAHLGGMIFGFFIIKYWHRRR